MTDLEDRLRAELADFAERADPALIRPLREPAVRGRSRVPRWMAPAAAVAAVVAVILGVPFAIRVVGHGGAQGAVTPPFYGGAATGVPPVYRGAVTGVPPFYVVASGNPVRVVVRSSATGAALATTQIRSRNGTPMVSGTADGRTFLIVQNDVFYRLRVGPDGRTARLSRLPVETRHWDVDDAALSPDGSQVAIAEQSHQYQQVQVRSLATGATRTWRTRAFGAPWNVSWSASGQQVGFFWEAGRRSPPPSQRDGYRLLNVADPGDNLLAAGAVVSVTPNPGGDIPAAFVTPDGQGFVTSRTQDVPGSDHHVTVFTKIIELSARTGQVQRVLYAASRSGVPDTYGNAGDAWESGCAVLSLDPAGQHPLVRCFLLGRYSFGTLASGRLKPLPGTPDIYCVRECRGPMSATAAW
jgi:hypothetical protein